MWDDLRHSLLALAKAPAFTLLVVSTLALAIGANTAIFSVVDQVLLSPLPLPNPQQLVRVQERHGRLLNVTGATFHDLAAQSTGLRHLTGYRTFFQNVADIHGATPPEQVTAAFVSEEFFPLVEMQPQLGRTFAASDFNTTAARTVILSDVLWRRMFGADPSIVGRTIQFHGQETVVAAIMPRGFDFPESVDAWVPLTDTAMFRQNRRSHLYRVIGRLAPGASLERANAELSTIAARVDKESRFADRGVALSATDLRESLVGEMRRPLLILLGSVAFILLIGCANLINLQLTRSFSKQKEVATKIALGATRKRIVRYVFSETACLAVGGGVIGSIFGYAAVAAIAASYPGVIPRLRESVVDWRLMLFAATVCFVAACIAGLLPAIHIAGVDPATAFGGAGRSTETRSRTRFRFALSALEIGLAVVLLSGAGLLIRSFLRLQSVDPGYDAHNVAVIPVTLPDARFPTFTQRVQFTSSALTNLAGVPGVRSVAAAGVLPLSGAPETGFELAGKTQDADHEASAQVFTASPDYFQTMSVPLLAGRMFTGRDSSGAPVVVLINDAMAHKYYAGENPVGQIVTMKDWGDPLTAQIVGIVGDIRQDSLDTAAKPAVFFSYSQFTQGTLVTYLLAKTDRDPQLLASTMRDRVLAVDRQIPVKVSTMETVIAKSLMQRRFLLTVLMIFAGLALSLAAVGVYGVISYSVSQRTREVGIRFAVGAQRKQVLAMILSQSLAAAMIGIAAGLAVAAALTRIMSNMLYGVSSHDPLTYLVVTAILVLVAVAAGLVPAVRAMRVEPTIALRTE